MARSTVDIPEPLHKLLRQRAEQSGTSIRSLIVRAIEQAYAKPKRGYRLTGPMIKGGSKRGPRFSTDENPHVLVFSWTA
jgi:hypothetical protein